MGNSAFTSAGVGSGSVEIKQIVREAGTRTKMAVYSDQSGIDPVGSCVGQKGVRVQAVLQEVNGEKIDIIQYTTDMKSYITQALAPAKEVTVHLDEEAKTAKVHVPEDQLSLAIGKDGQNVRLASKLTGYRIEIEGAASTQTVVEPEAEESVAIEDQVENLSACLFSAYKLRRSTDGRLQYERNCHQAFPAISAWLIRGNFA
jgi:N utilization substance protein A